MTYFKEFELKTQLIQSITELGFENPTPIQEETIPFVLSSKQDLIGLAQTGTGKTAAFGLPVLNNVDLKNNKTQALMLSPTRELCMQIYNDLLDYSKYLEGIKIVVCYGGASIETQIRNLRAGAHIIVATPGRMHDLLRRKAADISNIEYLVLDEADEMLNMGFRDELDDILQFAPQERQTLLFSATMPKEVASLAQIYLSEPVEISVGKKNSGATNVEHDYYLVNEKQRYEAMRRVVDFYPSMYSIVFCRTRQDCQNIATKLINDGYPADALHGDLSQAQRDYAMGRFRSRAIRILVATDVAARGIDVDSLTHVINYNLPDDYDIYLHRSGRTGRAGNEGVSVALINVRERYKIKHLEKRVGKSFVQKQIPTGEEICKSSVTNYMNLVADSSIVDEQIDFLFTMDIQRLRDMDKEELINRFLSVHFNQVFEAYRNVPDLNVKDVSEKSKEKKEARKAKQGFTRMFINVGRIDGFDKQLLIDFVRDIAQQRDVEVIEITIRERFSIFSYPNRDIANLKKSASRISIDSRDLRIDEMDRDDGKRGGGESSKGGKSYNKERKSNKRNSRDRDRNYRRERGKSNRDFEGGEGNSRKSRKKR